MPNRLVFEGMKLLIDGVESPRQSSEAVDISVCESLKFDSISMDQRTHDGPEKVNINIMSP